MLFNDFAEYWSSSKRLASQRQLVHLPPLIVPDLAMFQPMFHPVAVCTPMVSNLANLVTSKKIQFLRGRYVSICGWHYTHYTAVSW